MSTEPNGPTGPHDSVSGGLPDDFWYTSDDPTIADASHAGRTLRGLAVPAVGLFIRAIVAALPAGFWVAVFQLVIRLLPYLTTPAMKGAAMGVTSSQIEDAIRKAAD